MKKLILTVVALSFTSFCFADTPKEWTLLGKKGNESIYYWNQIEPSHENKNWLSTRIVSNNSTSQESITSELLFDCANKTMAATYQARSDGYFSEGEILDDGSIDRIFKPADDELHQKLLKIVCKIK